MFVLEKLMKLATFVHPKFSFAWVLTVCERDVLVRRTIRQEFALLRRNYAIPWHLNSILKTRDAMLRDARKT